MRKQSGGSTDMINDRSKDRQKIYGLLVGSISPKFWLHDRVDISFNEFGIRVAT